MQVAPTTRPDATATFTVRPPPANDMERMARNLVRLERENPAAVAAWQEHVERDLNEAWDYEIAQTRRLRNAALIVGVSNLCNVSNLLAGTRSDHALTRAAAWSGLICTGYMLAQAAWQTYDLATLPPARRPAGDQNG